MKLTLEEELEEAQIKAEDIKDKFLRRADTILDYMDALGPEEEFTPSSRQEYTALDNTHTATETLSDDADELYDEIVEAIDSLQEFYELMTKLKDLKKKVTTYYDDPDHTAIREKVLIA